MFKLLAMALMVIGLLSYMIGAGAKAITRNEDAGHIFTVIGTVALALILVCMVLDAVLSFPLDRSRKSELRGLELEAERKGWPIGQYGEHRNELEAYIRSNPGLSTDDLQSRFGSESKLALSKDHFESTLVILGAYGHSPAFGKADDGKWYVTLTSAQTSRQAWTNAYRYRTEAARVAKQELRTLKLLESIEADRFTTKEVTSRTSEKALRKDLAKLEKARALLLSIDTDSASFDFALKGLHQIGRDIEKQLKETA